MPPTQKLHDMTYRHAMSQQRVAREFLQQHLPENVRTQIDFSSLERCPETYVSKALEEKLTDMLYSVQIAGQSGYIYLLLEHQSTAEKDMALRVTRYVVEIMEAHYREYQCCPFVYPMVLYNGRVTYPYSHFLADLVEGPDDLIESHLLKGFQLIDLNHIPDTELRQGTWAGLLQYFMKHARDRDFLKQLKELMPVEIRFIFAHEGKDFISLLLQYCILVSNIDKAEDVSKLAGQYLSEKMGGSVMTLAERLMEQGLEQGSKLERLQIAKRLLQERIDLKSIMSATQLSLSQLEELRSQLNIRAEAI